MPFSTIGSMFIRTKKTTRSQSTSVQLVESFRVNGCIKQRVVRHVGTAQTEEKLAALKQLAEAVKVELIHQKLSEQSTEIKTPSGHFLGKMKAVSENTFIHAAHLEESQRTILGIHDVYGYMYDQIGFSNPFSRPQQRTYAAKVLREIVLARIAFPTSKRASVDLLREKFNVTLNLDHVYQMMDKIDELFCERIQKLVLATTLKLTEKKLRVVFYDATTLYFESFIEDELKQNGYSKDMKFNQSQLLLALFVTENGLPVGYELFPGSTFEGHTLLPVLTKLKQRYQLDEVVFVADRGLLSETNLQYLEANNIHYIVGARIKNVSKTLQAKILDNSNYQEVMSETAQKIGEFIDERHRRLIVSYSSERARKDEYDRQKSISKLRKKIGKNKDPKSLLNNYGYKKYIEIRGDASIAVNELKLEQESRWDGLLGIITNLKETNAQQLLTHYRSLWQIEECFRINKHDLKMRPIYHWTPQRIKAHIAIAFMAFTCIRYLEYRLSLQSQKLSPETIRQALLQVQASVIKDNKSGKSFFLPAKINPHAKEIYRVLHVKTFQRVMEVKM
jgi:transposase